MENREKIRIENKFDDFAECTDYYYDELGKLMEMSDGTVKFKKKDQMRLYSMIMDSYFANLSVINEKLKANKVVDKTEIKEFKSDFKKAHQNSSFTKALKLPFVGLCKLTNLSKNGLRKLINKASHGKRCVDVELIPPGETPQAIEAVQANESQVQQSSSPAPSESTVVSSDSADSDVSINSGSDTDSSSPAQDEVLDF